jgi:hypothetical protein
MGIETTSESWKIGVASAQRVGRSNLAVAHRSFYFAKDENPTFQIRSSWAQFSRFERFQRFYVSITYVFSMNTNIPTPPASTMYLVDL